MANTSLHDITLPASVSGETFPGFTLAMDSSDDTAFAGSLERVRLSWKAAGGTVALTLSSEGSDITISSATAYAWGFTVEPRLLTLPAGVYSWAVETTDSAGVINKDFMSGTHKLIADNHN